MHIIKIIIRVNVVDAETDSRETVAFVGHMDTKQLTVGTRKTARKEIVLSDSKESAITVASQVTKKRTVAKRKET